MVQQIADRVHVFEGDRRLCLVDLFEQLVQNQGYVGNCAWSLGAKTVQERTNQVTQVDQLVLGFDDGLEVFLDIAGKKDRTLKETLRYSTETYSVTVAICPIPL